MPVAGAPMDGLLPEALDTDSDDEQDSKLLQPVAILLRQLLSQQDSSPSR